MANNNNNNNNKRGIDTLLTSQGRSLKIGEEIRFTLIKGPSNALFPDPVNPKAPTEQFPMIAKFPESVVKPNLQAEPWNTARLYQQDVPKAQDDSEDEDEDATVVVKRRWQRRKKLPKRQWILQENIEFLESKVASLERKTQAKDQTSTRYEGFPEHNPSQYVLLETSGAASIQVTALPAPQATISFSQPKARKTLSMTEAERAIEDQRGKMTRFMMHDKQSLLHQEQKPTNQSRKRLFGKLTAKRKTPGKEDDADDDDIMGDLAFRNRKGSGKKARKELLSTLGDAGIKVDADGVLGGNNDSIFGRGQRFGRFQNDTQKQEATAPADSDDKFQAEPSTRGNDGNAMADDFYQRDVGAEYEELDYDANEQFDDDDVDVGETEVVVEGGGFDHDDDDDDMDDENMDGEELTGAEGLSSLKSFRLMLAKARGDITPEQIAEAAEKEKQKKEEAERRRKDFLSNNKNLRKDDTRDNIASIFHQKPSIEDNTGDNGGGDGSAPPPPAAQETAEPDRTHDENGDRIITLDSVKNEIWLRNGRIPIKKLQKIFSIKKKRTKPERYQRFVNVIKEVCTMLDDPIEGKLLVLKQHYSK